MPQHTRHAGYNLDLFADLREGIQLWEWPNLDGLTHPN